MATKERRKAPPGAPAYRRLTEEKRIIIETLRKEGCPDRHMAGEVGCHPTTVWRKPRRNLGKKGCRHRKAQGKANHRATVKAAKKRRSAPEMWALVKARLPLGAVSPTNNPKAESPRFACHICRRPSKRYGFYWTMTRHFPYSIYYDISNEVARVYAVIDNRRDPNWIYSHLQMARASES